MADWEMYKKKGIKRKVKRMNVIDVHDLTEEDAKFIQGILELLRQRKRVKGEVLEKPEEINFSSWPLGVKGRLSREEIYDYL